MYKVGIYITDPIGNNEFSYQERIELGSTGKIFVPPLIQGSLDDLEEGSEIVFEEVVNTTLISCTGLKHFVQITYEGIPIYIVDNHNHVLSFWNQYRLTVGSFEHITVFHIDQHADTKDNKEKRITNDTGGDNIEDFVQTKTNVGNFITAATNSGIINKVIQIRSDYSLQQLGTGGVELGSTIVDIDIDFRVGKVLSQEDIFIIKSLIKNAKLVTIATSPYFIDQERAIKIIKELLQ
ncbi:MAG TPA: UPF0489 family protein [Candidatus Absconditabacterales bacterium]|nr:UPF0489 family protein [Candidatus Absconditabacterales bacterium]